MDAKNEHDDWNGEVDAEIEYFENRIKMIGESE